MKAIIPPSTYPIQRLSSFNCILLVGIQLILIISLCAPAYPKPFPFVPRSSTDNNWVTINHKVAPSFQPQHHQSIKVQKQQNQKKKKNDRLQNFITLEKQRMNKIIEYERKRLNRLNDFLAFEKKRLKELERQEKESFSSMKLLFGGAIHDDISDGNDEDDDFSTSLVKMDATYWRRSLGGRTSPFTSENTIRKAGWKILSLDASTGRKSPSASAFNNINKISSSKEDYVLIYEPETQSPSMVIMFLGGAGLGQFPHITYSEFCSRISKKLDAVIITTPYQTGLDHYELSKDTGVKLHRALAQCQKSGRYSSSMPKYFLGHSLGSKLWTISTAAMNDVLGEELAGIGLISFNNFGFFDTTKQVKTFADTLNVKRTKKTAQMIDKILEFAEQAVTMSEIEFSPSPSTTTDCIIKNKYDGRLLKKTRLFVFDDDDLDSSKAFVQAVKDPQSLSLSGLPGTHLAPVYIKLELDDLELPPETKKITKEATGGFQSFSYGDEDYLLLLVNEVCEWILGNEPTRGPLWHERESIVLNK